MPRKALKSRTNQDGEGTSATQRKTKLMNEDKEKTPRVNRKKAKAAIKTEIVKEENADVKVKTITFKGSVPVDDHCIQCRDNFHVYKEGDDVYNAMLNQTNIAQNNNKYYLLQLLESNAKSREDFVIWFRWGRVGKVAGKTFQENLSLTTAKQLFEKKFLEKTKNHFHERHEFEKVAGKYDLLQMDYGDEAKNVKKESKTAKKQTKKEVMSNLHEKLQTLIQLLFNVNEFEESVKEMQYDVNKAPLGKLTEKQIKSGFESLKKIESLLTSTKMGKLSEACSEFYTKIPHDFGMKVPPLIRRNADLKKKIELLEALGDIQIALKMMEEEEKGNKLNKIDAHYHTLNCHIEHVDQSQEDYKLIEKYVKNTHGSTHTQYELQVEDIFRINKDENSKKFKSKLGNRMLLWHGSRLTNWCSILRQGLKIAPPEAPVTGYMFGKGIYFADMVSKSANYCYASQRQPYGMLVLCEVALGKTNDLTNADYEAHKLPKGKDSVKGIGKLVPDEKQFEKMKCGTIVPCGIEIASGDPKTTLYYNEYIVYDVNQIKPRFLVKLKLNFNSWF